MVRMSWGPLHTWAKSRDHEIVRAQKKVSKGRPKTRLKSCSEITGPQPLSINFYPCKGPHIWYHRINQRLWDSRVPWVIFETIPSDHETWSIWCHLRIHVDFTSVGPSNAMWSKLGLQPPFPPMKMLEVQWSRALGPLCEVALGFFFYSCSLLDRHRDLLIIYDSKHFRDFD